MGSKWKLYVVLKLDTMTVPLQVLDINTYYKNSDVDKESPKNLAEKP